MNFLKKILFKKRKNNRFKISSFNSVSMKINGIECSVNNLSFNGIGINWDENLATLRKGETVSAILNFENICLEIKVQVAYKNSKGIIGLKVIENQKNYEGYLKQYFLSEIQALKIKKMDPSKLKKEYEGTPCWYYGDYNHELFYLLDNDNNVSYFQLNFQGYIFEKNGSNSLSTGHVVDESSDIGLMKHKGSEIVNQYESVPAEIFQYAIRFTNSIEDINSEHKNFIISCIEEKLNS